MKKASGILLALAALLIISPAAALADDWYGAQGGYYTVYDQDGQVLFTRAGIIYVDDEYISGDNKLYRVTAADDTARRASAVYVEDVAMPDSQPLVLQAAAGKSNGVIALYCTHTDESYVPTEGSESVEGKGGIVDVAQEISDKLTALNYEVVFDSSNHTPHDAGAYRRSRRTAVKLMNEAQPLAILDIHRDGIPDESEYIADVNGEQVSKVRLVVGRSNQNKDANKEFAVKIKKMADEAYPGLIKDIYIGKGTYNQDVMPRSLIVEVGTHTLDKELALKSAALVADSVAYALGGAKPGESSTENNQGQGAAPGNTPSGTGQPKGQNQSQSMDSAQKKASFSGIAWVIGIVAAAGIAMLIIAMNRSGRMHRVGNFFRELTGIGTHKK